MFSALNRGTFISLIFGIAILLFAFLFWRQFFVYFHEVFFDSGTWTFDASSGIIRLFPESFWFFLSLTLIARIIIFSVVGYILILVAQGLYAMAYRFSNKEGFRPYQLFELLKQFGMTVIPFGFLVYLINFSFQIQCYIL